MTDVLPSAALSVLVVDGYEDAAQSTAELLALCGHAVRVAGCGADALREAAAEMPDVVLLDIGLPDIDGWQVAERMRRQATGKQPVVVAVTGYGAEADRQQSADAGIDLHIIKPADPVALTDLLARVRRDLHSCRSVPPAVEPLVNPIPVPEADGNAVVRAGVAALVNALRGGEVAEPPSPPRFVAPASPALVPPAGV